jgi:hypothetical protein
MSNIPMTAYELVTGSYGDLTRNEMINELTKAICANVELEGPDGHLRLFDATDEVFTPGRAAMMIIDAVTYSVELVDAADRAAALAIMGGDA